MPYGSVKVHVRLFDEYIRMTDEQIEHTSDYKGFWEWLTVWVQIFLEEISHQCQGNSISFDVPKSP